MSLFVRKKFLPNSIPKIFFSGRRKKLSFEAKQGDDESFLTPFPFEHMCGEKVGSKGKRKKSIGKLLGQRLPRQSSFVPGKHLVT